MAKQCPKSAWTKITFVSADDWEGLYVDEQLMLEGHHVRLEDLFSKLGIPVEFVTAEQSWLEAHGRLPKYLCDVVHEQAGDVDHA